MTYEMVVGQAVVDDLLYQQYRSAMAPLLAAHGASFRYDFTIQQVLQSASEHPIHRVFVISFPTKSQRNEFFADPEHQAIEQRFQPSFAGTTILGGHERNGPRLVLSWNQLGRIGRRLLLVAVAAAIAIVSFLVGANTDRSGPHYRIVDGDREIAILFPRAGYQPDEPSEWVVLDARGRPIADQYVGTIGSSSPIASKTDANGRAPLLHAMTLEAAGTSISPKDVGCILTIEKP
ncbi:MAG: DUF1330 domain-containing protein [Planctomycetes bacterium]|nr:DUF1330 domain-containing protein [Planctomycetota bacterium]